MQQRTTKPTKTTVGLTPPPPWCLRPLSSWRTPFSCHTWLLQPQSHPHRLRQRALHRPWSSFLSPEATKGLRIRLDCTGPTSPSAREPRLRCSSTRAARTWPFTAASAAPTARGAAGTEPSVPPCSTLPPRPRSSWPRPTGGLSMERTETAARWLTTCMSTRPHLAPWSLAPTALLQRLIPSATSELGLWWTWAT